MATTRAACEGQRGDGTGAQVRGHRSRQAAIGGLIPAAAGGSAPGTGTAAGLRERRAHLAHNLAVDDGLVPGLDGGAVGQDGDVWKGQSKGEADGSVGETLAQAGLPSVCRLGGHTAGKCPLVRGLYYCN